VAAWATLALGLATVIVGGLRTNLLDLQLSGDPELIRRVVQGDARRVKRHERALLADYGFIVLYWLTFVGLSVAITRRDGWIYDALGLLAVLSATATALLDVAENIRTRGMLALTRPSDQVRLQPVAHLRKTSLAKWAASALTLGLLAALFLPGEDWMFVLGLAYICVGALGLAAVRWNVLVKFFFLLFSVLGVIVAVAFTFFPDSVREQL
jgi:hypothetical protein